MKLQDIVVGDMVRVVKIVPQQYEDKTWKHAEVQHHSVAIGKVGKVVAVAPRDELSVCLEVPDAGGGSRTWLGWFKAEELENADPVAR